MPRSYLAEEHVESVAQSDHMDDHFVAKREFIPSPLRREAQEIIPGLWLGPFGSARDQELLATRNAGRDKREECQQWPQEFLKRVNITDALVVRAPEEARRIAADLRGLFQTGTCTTHSVLSR